MADRDDGWDDKEIGRPSVLRLGDAYWMWYAGCDSRFERAIGLAHSADGVAWERFGPGPVLKPPARRREAGSHSYSNPSVAWHAGRFWLVANAQGTQARIDLVVASSADGATWEVLATLPAAPTKAGYGAPSLVVRDGRGHLFVPLLSGTDGSEPGGTALHHATSNDLLAWHWHPGEPFRRPAYGRLDYPWVVPTADGFMLWCSVYRDGHWTIVRAEGTDGTAWSDLEPVIEPGPVGALDSAGVLGPSVLVEDGRFVMWHLGSSRHADGHRVYVLRSVSDDGGRWRRDPDRPVFRPGFGRYLNPF